VDDPESADIILVGNVREENWGEKILSNALIDRYPGKSFSLSDRADPLIVHHGVYTSGPKSYFQQRRVRTGAYTLYPDEYINPYVVRHMPSDEDSGDKQYLFSFLGRNCHPVRDTIFQLSYPSDVLIEDTTNFNLWHADEEEKLQKQRRFYRILLQSKFSLCPRGASPNSMRLFESMQLGVAPIIVTTNWTLPQGPSWDDFSILVKPRELRHLVQIVRAHENDHIRMGQMARQAYERFFAEDVYFDYIVDRCCDIAHSQRLPEVVFWKVRHITVGILRIRRSLRIRSRLRALLVNLGGPAVQWQQQ
jgi:hypothetical protein